jgi:hypothetical protein
MTGPTGPTGFVGSYSIVSSVFTTVAGATDTESASCSTGDTPVSAAIEYLSTNFASAGAAAVNLPVINSVPSGASAWDMTVENIHGSLSVQWKIHLKCLQQ